MRTTVFVITLAVFCMTVSAQTADTLTFTAQPTSVQANASFNITVTAQDSAMAFATDTGYTSAVTLSVQGAYSGAFNGILTVAAVAGVATFTGLDLTQIASVTLDADDGTLPTGSSNPITVTADRLVITVPATIADTVAGANINGGTGVEVRAQDGAGNTDAGFAGTVNIALQSGTGTLSGGASEIAAAGIATFNGRSINLIGPKTLRFTATGLTLADSNSFNITPAADDAVFFIQQPSNVQTGQPITPAITVRIRDQFGNDTASTADVTLAIGTNPGVGTIGGTTLQAASSGLATFGNITISAAGTGYTLTASSAGLTGDTSSTFNVTSTPTPTISIVGALTAFSTTGIGVPSAQQSYSVSGANLAADITIDAPTHFQISTTSGSGFGAQVVLPETGGTVGSTTIFVRYNPAGAGPHSGNIVHSSTGATPQNQPVTGSIAAPAGGSLSASNNPGSRNVSPGSSASALGFRVAETGGSSTLTITQVIVEISLLNNTGGVGAAAITSVSLRRGSSTLATINNGGGGWSATSTTLTLTYSGLSAAISGGANADFSVVISFSSATPPSPSPGYIASVDAADISANGSIAGTTVTGGTITLVEDLPDDPFAEDKEDSCELSTRGGPAWPALLLFVGLLAAAYRVRRARE